MENLARILGEHDFFADLDPQYLDLIVGCTRNTRFRQGDYLFREGEEANGFFLIRHGRVAIEMEINFKPTIVMTLEPGEILGWSWLLPPYQWGFSARAVNMTRTLALDGKCLRGNDTAPVGQCIGHRTQGASDKESNDPD